MESVATFQYEGAQSSPIVVRMGRMETAEQFFARLEGQRGRRVVIDKALAWARDAVESGLLSPFHQASVETDRAVVLAALAADPRGVIEPSPEIRAACTRLRDLGRQARLQPLVEAEAIKREKPIIEAEERKRGTKEARKARTGQVSPEAIKRQKAVIEIAAKLEKRDIRATAQRIADKLAKIKDENGKPVYRHRSRRTVDTDLKKVGKD
jgi:hypothetical protein